jgi:hypothetical protein
MALAQAQLGTSVTTVYTSTGDSATTCIFFCNTNGTSETIDVYAVPSGDTAGITNQIIDTLTINSGDTYIMNVEKLVLSNGDSIQAVATTGSVVTCTVSYVGI